MKPTLTALPLTPLTALHAAGVHPVHTGSPASFTARVGKGPGL
jgi:hypothetical protein